MTKERKSSKCAKNAEDIDEKGFSMMEVLVALAIGGLLLVSSTDLLVSISKRWIDGPSSKMPSTLTQTAFPAFSPRSWRKQLFQPSILREIRLSTCVDRSVFSDSEDPLIHFYLRDAPPFFVWPKGPAQRVHAYLYFEEGEGLSIAWFSELQELEKNEEGEMALEDEDELFKTGQVLFARRFIIVEQETKTTENSISRNGSIRLI